jgi:hypothetical protein
VKPKHEVSEIIQEFRQEYILKHKPNSYILRTLYAIEKCRTSALGGHLDKCDSCGKTRISYNSCRNRHCPKCQNTYREQWIEARLNDLLPVNYFHVVFTMPAQLNNLCLKYPVKMYNLLLKSAWDTLFSFGYNNSGVETGMLAVLHTWGQNLSLHPHLHCIVPGGGVDIRNNWKFIGKPENNFLYPVKQLSKVFRGKYIEYLRIFIKKENIENANVLINDLYKNDWVVYSKPLFLNAGDVVKYLGRYTHKIAISNHRLISLNDNNVLFTYKDYKDHNKVKKMQLSGTEFLRRFSQHILPKRFVRIRYYGFLSSTKKYLFHEIQSEMGITIKKNISKKKNWKQICRERLNFDPDICPFCNKGKMITIEIIEQQRGPPLITEQIRRTFKL